MIWDVFYGNYVGVVDFVKYIQGKNKNKNIDFFCSVYRIKSFFEILNILCNVGVEIYLLKYYLVLFKYD